MNGNEIVNNQRVDELFNSYCDKHFTSKGKKKNFRSQKKNRRSTITNHINKNTLIGPILWNRSTNCTCPMAFRFLLKLLDVYLMKCNFFRYVKMIQKHIFLSYNKIVKLVIKGDYMELSNSMEENTNYQIQWEKNSLKIFKNSSRSTTK